MKSFKLLTFSALALISLGSISSVAIADEAASGDTAKTTAKVTLEKPDTDKPVDPIDPTDPGDITGNKGPLTIDVAPNLVFKTTKISDKVGNDQLDLDTPNNPHVQVSDRRATGAGWNLTGELTKDFTLSSDETKILKGASIDFNDGVVKSADVNNTDAPTGEGKINIAKDNASLVMNAAKDKGLGTWSDSWETNNVKLNYNPQGAYAGEYTGEITWTLSDAPQA